MSEFEDRMENMGVEKGTPTWRFYFEEFGSIQRGERDPSAEPGVFNEEEHQDLGHSKRRRLRREEAEERRPEPSLPGGPVAPPGGDFMTGMGRTNDAILYGGLVHLFVQSTDDEAKDLADKMPSNTSSDYGRPFAETFKSYEYDFFKIDPMLFSPAKVIVTNTNTGNSFTAGELNPTMLASSFGL